MLSIGQFVLLLGGTLVIWVGVGYLVATVRHHCWPVLLWSVFFLISGIRMITQAFGLWPDAIVPWYILTSLALMAVLTFTLKYRGWRILQAHGIHGRQLLLFWQK